MVDNSGGSQEVELNLAPIIDCFTVLITYLLVTASFLTFAAVDVGVSANNPSAAAPPPPLDDKKPLTMTMDVDMNHQIILKVSGGDLKSDYELKVPGKGDTWDAATLEKHLQDISARWAKLTEVSVSAAPTVKYKELVNVINATQKTMPKVFISGG
jgi:biopolymer transport protein ExbD